MNLSKAVNAYLKAVKSLEVFLGMKLIVNRLTHL